MAGTLVVALLFSAQPAAAEEYVSPARVSYEINIRTAPDDNSGTDSGSLWVKLTGAKGSTEYFVLETDADEFNAGYWESFQVPATRRGVGDVGRPFWLSYYYCVDSKPPECGFGGDDWQYAQQNVYRKVDGQKVDYTNFPGSGWLGNDAKAKTVTLIDEAIMGKSPSRISVPSIVLHDDWVWKRNRSSASSPGKKTVTFELNEEKWASKVKEKSVSTEASVGLEAEVMGVKVTEQLKVATARSVKTDRGEKVVFSKTGEREIDMSCPAQSQCIRRFKWVVNGDKYTLGNLVQWIPDPSSLRLEAEDLIQIKTDGSGKLVYADNGKEISAEHAEIIRLKSS